ncbi:MAG TPA: hypothetical protein VLZ12_13180 [Verrucomicrobiae bacterium]|nr:hypothetical protein [Verrucomicrobiae bacterium]
MRIHLALTLAVICGWMGRASVEAQNMRTPWSGYGHDPQHNVISPVPSQPLNRILWQTPVDLNPQYSGNDLLIHYGSPLVTRSNTVIVPVKTGATSGFRIEGRTGTNGVLKWTQFTDYRLPPHSWTPSFSPALTPKDRLYFPGGGGTVYFRDSPDAASGTTGQIAFYGLANFNANTNAYLANVMINTPITSDRYGNIFFGFQVTNATPVALTSGVARIDFNGNGTWISAAAAAVDSSITKVVHNCAPALSNNHKTLYVAVRDGSAHGYLVALDSRTLTPLAKVRLKDVKVPANDAQLLDDGTASPTVGPDGDVYFGVFEYSCCINNDRGWLRHFDGTLAQSKIAGAFGWDDTASVVPASMVPSYQGSSSYLLMTKYNNYAGVGGDGINRIAILDPNDGMIDPITGATVMKDVLTIPGATPDPEYIGSHPNAVREWCINSAAIDPFTMSVLANSEDGKLYRWSLDCNMLMQPITLTPGVGEAYTPTVIGVDGIVYAINNATLFAVGR